MSIVRGVRRQSDPKLHPPRPWWVGGGAGSGRGKRVTGVAARRRFPSDTWALGIVGALFGPFDAHLDAPSTLA